MSFKTLTIILLINILPNLLGTPLTSKPEENVKDLLSSRIVGGIDAPPGYAKHMVALIYGKIFRIFSCGGSILTNRHILSAAHCIAPFFPTLGLLLSFRGTMGSNYWSSSAYTVYFLNAHLHPHYDSAKTKNDIGVLVTRTTIIFNDVIAPITLNFEKIEKSLNVYVTGWGNTVLDGDTPDILKLLYLRTLTVAQCIERIESALAGSTSLLRFDPALEICALHSYGHGVCHGDSGSALMRADSREQVGVVSWGFPCARGAPDVYARVSPHRDWLTNVTASL